MQPSKKSSTAPVVVGIVLPILLLVFVGVAALLQNFIFGDIGSSPTANSTRSGLSGFVGVFALVGVVWLVAGIVWTIKSKRK